MQCVPSKDLSQKTLMQHVQGTNLKTLLIPPQFRIVSNILKPAGAAVARGAPQTDIKDIRMVKPVSN